jgi:hypothetical protein
LLGASAFQRKQISLKVGRGNVSFLEVESIKNNINVQPEKNLKILGFSDLKTLCLKLSQAVATFLLCLDTKLSQA